MYNIFLKRFIDLVFVFFLAIPLLPVGLLISLIIKLTSKGPVFFIQERTGLHGKPFFMYKFRSMTKDNDVHDKSSADKVTKIGKILRTTSLDEIPQIINIFKGDMSFIGPRPWITEYHKHLTLTQKKRNSVKPGITGRAQAYGRNALSVHDKIEHDLKYVEYISFKEDLRIVIQTLKTIGNKSIIEIGKHGIHHELSELKAQWAVQHNPESAKQTSSNNQPNLKTSSPLVSIVVPVFNASKFLDETIKTVKDQTHQNWELIMVDDKSSDDSIQIIKRYAKSDPRIKFIENKSNLGAALSRNAGIDKATGKYLAFLDADDLWVPHKLEKQVNFMQEKNCAFSFTGYEFADHTGKPNGKKVFVPSKINYKQALKNTTISTITVMFDLEKLLKEHIYICPMLKVRIQLHGGKS